MTKSFSHVAYMVISYMIGDMSTLTHAYIDQFNGCYEIACGKFGTPSESREEIIDHVKLGLESIKNI